MVTIEKIMEGKTPTGFRYKTVFYYGLAAKPPQMWNFS